MIAIVRDSGGIEQTRKLATQASERARAALHGLPAGPSLSALLFAAEYAVQRRF